MYGRLRPRNEHVISALRGILGLSQKQFAALVGCSHPTIQAIELGRLKLSKKLAWAISEATGVAPEWLLQNDLTKPPWNNIGASQPYTVADFDRVQNKETLSELAGSKLDRELLLKRIAFQFDDDITKVLREAVREDASGSKLHLVDRLLKSAVRDAATELGTDQMMQLALNLSEDLGKLRPAKPETLERLGKDIELVTTPEERARQQIDILLQQSGWIVQDRSQNDLSPSTGLAIREVVLKTGEADYLLFAGGKAIATIEAKPEGYTLTGVEEQSRKYAEGLRDIYPSWGDPLVFAYESTGSETRFTNRLDPNPTSRGVFAFHRPETLMAWATQTTQLTQRLREMPPLIAGHLWPSQVEAIQNLEDSLAQNRPRALIQMATGSGKTFTAVNFVYRLIKHAGARRVLFLVDRANLGDQTLKEFQQFVAPDDGRKFTELYNIQHLQSAQIDTISRVTISTIQRLYSMLQGKELDPAMDEVSGEGIASIFKEPVPVTYNPKVPIETFDFIVTDECHRSIYNLWRQVLEYFDAYLIGLTATPNKQTFGFFQQNLVQEYGHERAVADGVNVNYDVYQIKTEITARGSRIEKGFFIDKRNRQTRKVRWQQLDDDLAYDATELDRAVVAPDQIRTVIRTFRDRLFTEIFPGRTTVPKTLIFAKDDTHAEDIVRIVREEFGKGNDFCQKITYRTTGVKPEVLIQKFRNSYDPRIAVTVDMIATGTDIKPLEIVMFMRSVKSLGFFEQMKGRGVRVISNTEFQQVTPDAKTKTHFVIVDAVGVCERDKSDSRPLEQKKSVPFDKLLEGVAQGVRESDALSSLAGRLLRLEKRIEPELQEELEKLTGGKKLSQIARDLLDAIDPDYIEARVQEGKSENYQPGEQEILNLRLSVANSAVTPIATNPGFRQKLIELQSASEQTIDIISKDKLIFAGPDVKTTESVHETVRSFRKYIEKHKAEIEALQILYSRPFRQRLTEETLRDFETKLKPEFGPHPVESLWTAFEKSGSTNSLRLRRSQTRRFTDLVSLVRVALEQEPELQPFEEHVRGRFAEWIEEKRQEGITFTGDQMAWLEKMRDYVTASGSVDREHLETDNVLGPVYRIFGDGLWPLMEELNLALAA
jgi:type I restriction enzyme R subunit